MKNPNKAEPKDERPTSDRTTGWFELIAILIIGLALFFIFNTLFYWIARTYDVPILEAGRRLKFADALSAGMALLLTNLIAKLLGSSQPRVSSNELLNPH